MPRARNKIETARQVYFSLEMVRSLRRTMSAVRQQLTIVRKYRITVSQPPIVGSPIPGLQSNSCIRGPWLLALRNESWPDLSILISFEVRAMEIHNDNSIQHCRCIRVIRGRGCAPDTARSPPAARA